MFYWDTTDIFLASDTMKVDLLVTFKGRLVAAGREDAPRTIFMSEFTDGTSWNLAVDPVATDPSQIQVSGRLDEKISAFYPEFRDILMWYMPHSFGGIYGSNRDNFIARTFSGDIGCAYPRSVHDADGELRWLGPNRVFWGFDGVNFNKISEKIDTLVATVVQGDVNQRTWTQTSGADWNDGTFSINLSSVSSVGDLAMNVAGLVFDDFSDGDFSSGPQWAPIFESDATLSVTSNRLTCTGLVSGFAACSIASTNTLSFVLGLDLSVSFDYQMTQTAGSEAFIIQFSSSNLQTLDEWEAEHSIEVRFQETTGIDISETDTLLASKGSPNIDIFDELNHDIRIDVNNPTVSVYVDNLLELTTTGFTQLGQDILSINVSDRCSSQGCDEFVASTDNFLIWASTADFISQPFNVGNDITSWGPFIVNEKLNSGTIAYAIYGDTDTVLDITDTNSFSSSQTITSGSIPGISTASFVAVTADFSRKDSSETPTLNLFAVRWNEGSTLPLPSVFSNNRSWWSVAISSTGNNTILVYDKNLNWQKYTGIQADAMVSYNSNVHFGNESGVFVAEAGTTDNGASIASFFRTKDFAPSGPNINSYFDELYITADNSDASLVTTFFLDGVNTEYSLANFTMTTDSGNQDFKLPFPFTEIHQGKNISLKFSVTGTADWRLLNANLYYTPDRVTED